MKSVLYRSLIMLSVMFTAVLMNNCSMPAGLKSLDLSSGLDNLKASGGGTGYDGKLTYINLDKDKVCSSSASTLRSEIQIRDDGTAQVVRNNCQVVSGPSISLAQMDLLPHNLKNASYGGRAFDLLEAKTDPTKSDSASSQYFCRGTEQDGDTDQYQIADLILSHHGNAPFADTASVIMAVYDKNGKYLKTLDTAEVKVRNISTGSEGRLKYVSDIQGLYGITIWIDKVGTIKTAKLSLIELPYAGRDKESGYKDEDYQRNIQNLNCVTH